MEEMLDILTSESSPQGFQQQTASSIINRACANCARAKSKCIFDRQDRRTKCQRCNRLEKECQPTAARARPPAKKRRTTSSSGKPRVEKIEEKLDGLISLLKTNREGTVDLVVGASSGPLASKSGVSTVEHYSKPLPRAGSYGILALGNQLLDGAPLFTPAPSRPASEDSQNLPTSDEVPITFTLTKSFRPSLPAAFLDSNPLIAGFSQSESERLLGVFRKQMNPWFPFISFSQATYTSLRRERPFLLSSILALACQKAPIQRELGNELIKQLTERVFIHNERGIDLLLCYINYTGWCCYNFFNLTRLTGLLAAINVILRDLMLDKSHLKENATSFESAMRESCGRKYTSIPPRTLEEKRILLGCFYITSVLALQFHRTESLSLTEYLDECCEEVGATNSLSDRFASASIRVQIFNERVAQAPWNSKSSLGMSYSMPIMPVVKTLLAQLFAVKDSLSPEILAHIPITLAFHAAEIYLYRVGFAKSPLVPESSMPGLQRMELLCACHASIVALFNAFVTVPEAEYHSLTLPVYMQLAQGYSALTLLTTFEHSEWDMSYLPNPMDICDVLGTIADRFDSASAKLGLEQSLDCGEIHVFVVYAKKLRGVREFYRTKILTKTTADSKLNQATPPSEITNAEEVSIENPLDSIDEAWFYDWMAPLDFDGML